MTHTNDAFSGANRSLRLALSTALFLVLALAATASWAGPCGGEGQRACCNGDGEFSNHGVACNAGLAYTTANGCNDPNGCSCSGGIIRSESSAGMCYQPQACGGPGQRACCNGAAEFSNNGLACNAGLVQIPGTCGPGDPACICGGPSTNGLFPAPYASGICVQPAPCGGPGQRACCNGLTEFSNNGGACNSGTIEVPGCSGDCTCGGSTSIGEPSGNSCTVIEAIAEPTTNATPSPNEAGPPGSWTLPQVALPAGPLCPAGGLCGFAELHVHMFANLAHGGAILAGSPWDPNGVNVALAEDYGSNLPLVDKNGNPKHRVDGSAGLPQCPDFLRAAGYCAGQVLFHGDHTAFDTVTGGGTNDGANSNMGVPLFNGWPLWSSTVHQQVYYKWLERAWLGGMRLMVMFAVSNEALCKGGTKVAGTDCSLSMTAVDAQLRAAQTFQVWLDGQYGGPGKGWFQIVRTPGEAESAIRQGKLAVVLGIEVDNLFNCHLQNASGQPLNGEGPICTDTYVQAQLQKYFGMGVRHIFPIHDFDNAFGATATWQDAINAGNRAGEGVFQDAVNCTDAGYGFALDAATAALLYTLGFGGSVEAPVYPAFPNGSCHRAPGLTALGASLIQQAMDMGMIIDVDHGSIHAFNDTIDLAHRQSPVYAGIAATHVQFFDLYTQTYTGRYGRHERMRTFSQLQSIRNAGGMIAAMLKDDTQDTGNGWCLPQGNCPFGATTPWPSSAMAYTTNYDGANHPSNNNGALRQNCAYSTTEWAQAYLYGVQAMGGAPVAMGSDFNGIAGHLGPRFGNGACAGSAGQRAAQERANNRLAYPFTLPGFGTFDRQVSGQKIYDFNVDGLAHIGLVPDMVADLRSIGVTDEQLRPLFGSAQAYVDMWKAVFKASAPTVSMSGVPATAAYKSTFTVTTDNHGTTTSVPSLTAGPANVCSISGAVVTMTSGTGICSVTATWAADANYAKASITQTANATTIAPTVAFTGAPATASYGSRFPVSATTNATSAAVITVDAGSVCSIADTTVTMTSGIGACRLTATWAADSNYSAAKLAQATTATKATPSIDLTVDADPRAPRSPAPRLPAIAQGDTVTFVARIHAAGDVSPNGSITISDRNSGVICCQGIVGKDPDSNDGLATIRTAGLAPGDYTMVAVYGGDNAATYYNGAQSNTVALTVIKRNTGDVNADGIVNCADLDIVKASLGQRRGESGFRSTNDLNGDGTIDAQDLAILANQMAPGTLARCER